MENKRLSDAIIAAHKIACDEDKKEIALLLIEALEIDLTRMGGDKTERRKATAEIEGAFDLHEDHFGMLSPTDAKSGI